MRLKHSKLSHLQTNRLLEHFVAGTPARSICLLVKVHRNTATAHYHQLRLLIFENLMEEATELAGEVEVDESYFGSVRKGKRGRGAAGKIVVFGLLKRGGRVYTIAEIFLIRIGAHIVERQYCNRWLVGNNQRCQIWRNWCFEPKLHDAARRMNWKSTRKAAIGLLLSHRRVKQVNSRIPMKRERRVE